MRKVLTQAEIWAEELRPMMADIVDGLHAYRKEGGIFCLRGHRDLSGYRPWDLSF